MNDSPQRHEGHRGAEVGFRFALPNLQLQLQLGKGGHEPAPYSSILFGLFFPRYRF